MPVNKIDDKFWLDSALSILSSDSLQELSKYPEPMDDMLDEFDSNFYMATLPDRLSRLENSRYITKEQRERIEIIKKIIKRCPIPWTFDDFIYNEDWGEANKMAKQLKSELNITPYYQD